MGKKGSKRKTRWRTLSIGAPPGEEDEEDGLRKENYVKSQEKETNAHTHFERNGQQGGYKPRRAGTSISGGSTSGYASSGSRSHRDESAGSPSQPKIIFNEEEYTRITTPRQDVLFKKGYLSRKKPWTGNASTSATPSTTESQSASHSTADGSETTEDQQLLDRDSGTGEYPPAVEPGAQLGYGTFYDHASGYYYEYPVMLVGPAPVPAQVGPSVLATVPCGPVPLRPIEWINPAFVPKLANQPYCLMDYQTNQSTEPVPILEEQNGTIVAAETSNNVWHENGTGSASCSGSVAGEIEEQAEEMDYADMEQHVVKEQLTEEQLPEPLHLDGQQHLENGITTVDPYLDSLMIQEPVHMSHMMPAVPQPYMYPGHYMFGPPLVNVNGVTIQGGPLVRTMDVTTMMACAKRRKKRKKRKQRRPILGNTEDEEEGEYSSECDNDVSSSRLPWSESLISTTTMTVTNRPLNPECQEFQLRPALQSEILNESASVTTMTEEVASSVTDAPDVSSYIETESANCETETCDSSTAQSLKHQEETTIRSSDQAVTETSLENVQSTAVGHVPRSKNAEINSQANHSVANADVIITNEITEISSSVPTDCQALSRTDTTLENDSDSISANMKHELFEKNSNDVNTVDISSNCVNCPEESLTNGDTNHEYLADLTERAAKSRSTSPQDNSSLITTNINEKKEVQRLQYCNNSSIARATLGLSKKYNKKGRKFVRESTPVPDLDDSAHLDMENWIVQQFEAVELSDANCKCSIVNDDKIDEMERKVASEEDTSVRNEDTTKTAIGDIIEGSNEDSESQTRLSNKYQITAAVKEWLRRANSPDLFITLTSENKMDEDEEMDEEPPKNLQGNPMPALSANSSADNITLLSRTASCGEFAKTNNNNNNNSNNNNARNDQMEADSTTSIGRKKRDAKIVKRKTKAKKNDKWNKNVDEKAQSQLVSSLVSLDFVTAVESRDKSKNNVGDVCEFTQEDSVAGMRVALSSRINSKRVNAKRMKTLRKISQKNPVENIDIKMRCIDNLNNEEEGKGTSEGSTVSVRTFEKGEIIVSEDGRLLPMSSYEPVPFNDHCNPIAAKIAAHEDVINKNVETRERNSSENDENDSAMIASSVSIEEPDVLECWEAETVEPVITPRRMLQSPGVLCEGEAAEDDSVEIEKVTVEHVRRYYRLAARDVVNAEEESSEFSTSVISSKSRTVPNDPEDRAIGYFYGKEIPIFMPDPKNPNAALIGNEKIPIDEAFEVYESCYDGKSPFLPFDSKMFKQRPLYGQNGEGPIPCRAVCCNIQ